MRGNSFIEILRLKEHATVLKIIYALNMIYIDILKIQVRTILPRPKISNTRKHCSCNLNFGEKKRLVWCWIQNTDVNNVKHHQTTQKHVSSPQSHCYNSKSWWQLPHLMWTSWLSSASCTMSWTHRSRIAWGSCWEETRSLQNNLNESGA